MADVVVYASATEDVATLKGVRDAVRKEGRKVTVKAEGRLAAHRQSGNARIEMTDTGLYPNWGVTVSMIDERASNQGGPGALAIEFGHFVRTASGFPRYVQGLHILTGAVGMV
jgi:hypothetical protein